MGVEIQELTLRGGQDEYIDASSNADYVLACNYRSGYDENVLQVRWLRYGSPVYVWRASSNNPSGRIEVLIGREDESERGLGNDRPTVLLKADIG